MTEFDVEVKAVSEKFAIDYPNDYYPEIMCKENRPYAFFLIDLHIGYFICIPFRTNILHKNAFIFRSSMRSKRSRSGLDYTKVLLIKDSRYISDANIVVDNDEYNEMMINAGRIVKEICNYIDDYKKHIGREKILHPKEFERRYKYSTLKYFHDVLGI